MFAKEMYFLSEKFGKLEINCTKLHSFRVSKRRVYRDHGSWKKNSDNDKGLYYKHVKFSESIDMNLEIIR